MRVTFASALHYHSPHYAIVGVTNGKCTSTAMQSMCAEVCYVRMYVVSSAKQFVQHNN